METQIAKKSSTLVATAKQVLLLIDWDNLFISLVDRFGQEEIRLESRIIKLMQWVSQEIGGLLGGYGFVFAPEHLAFHFQQICVRNRLKIMICPKRQLDKSKRDPKTDKIITQEDTVDENIIWFAKTMFKHPEFKFLCLVAGDGDYVPLLEETAKQDIMIALAPPSVNSLSKTKKFLDMADKHPKTQKKMVLRLDTLVM